MTESDEEATSERWLTPGVVSVGAASFFSDAGHEIATSLLPSFLTSTLHAGPGALGAIEGLSDALIGVSKLAGGPLANDPVRRVRLAAGGYLGTAIATAAIGLTTAVWQVAVLRAVAWTSRGIRSPARDMMLTSIAPASAYGRAFGVERAGDNAGAIVGPLLAAGLVAAIGVREAIFFAIIPGALAAVAIVVAGREARRSAASVEGRRNLSLNLGELRRAGLVRVLTPTALFELGNVATTLLILRATGLLSSGPGVTRSYTAAVSLAIVLYAGHNAAATAGALVGGHAADRFGAQRVFSFGAMVYVAAYVIFAWHQQAVALLLLGFVLAGLGIGVAETTQSAVIARHLPEDLRSNGFGVLGLVQSLGDLGASLVAGLLWAVFSPTIAFVYAATWMVGSVIASWWQGGFRGAG